MFNGAPNPQAVAQSVAAAQSAEEEASAHPIGELPQQSYGAQDSAPASIISGLVGQELVVDVCSIHIFSVHLVLVAAEMQCVCV